MPEITVDKYDNATIPEHEVRTARKVTRVGFPGKAGFGKQGGKAKLRPRAFALDAGHNPTARLHRHDVPAVTPRLLRCPAGGVLSHVFVSHRFAFCLRRTTKDLRCCTMANAGRSLLSSYCVARKRVARWKEKLCPYRDNPKRLGSYWDPG